MHRSVAVLLCFGALMLAGCHAARPLQALSSSSSSSISITRQLLSSQWGGPSCSGFNGLGFGATQALALPAHNLVLGQVTLRNNGPQPFGFQSCGVRLAGPSPLDCNLRCPQNLVPAGGVLQCGFIAQAPQPQSFTGFQPFFVPQSSGGQCLHQQPFSVRPHFSPAAASAQADAFSNAGVAQAFANACAQAFGATYSDALSKATAWQGDAFSLANAIANSVFGSSAANSQAAAQSWGGAASAQGSANSNSGFGAAQAHNTASALSNQAAFAAGSAQAQTGFGPASAGSASQAVQTGFAGIASAVDKAAAFSGNGPAQASSQASALNAGAGPAVASATSSAVSGIGCGSSCGK